jgi:hypothetical protein
MNDQIAKTLNQPAFDRLKDWYDIGPVQKATLELFAELIVFECVNAVMDGTKEGDHYAQLIEQHFDNGTGGIVHFGVEE